MAWKLEQKTKPINFGCILNVVIMLGYYLHTTLNKLFFKMNCDSIILRIDNQQKLQAENLRLYYQYYFDEPT